MKAKKFLLIGLLMAGVAASGFAAYRFAKPSCSNDKECCVPGCCEGAEIPECCNTGN